MSVNLVITPEAEKAFSKLSEDKQADFVRITAGQACGCGRVGYQMQWESERSGDDHVLDTEGLVLLVGAESAPLIEGSVIDYKKEDMSEGFFISNPNASQGCGCGGH